MHFRKARIAIAVAVAALGIACERSPSPPAPPAPTAAPTVFELMVRDLMPQANEVWELAGAMYDDDGKPDASKLSAAQWTELTQAATMIRDAAQALAADGPLRVAPEGAKILNEGLPDAPGAAQVQAAIDANPAGFREEAVKLRELAAQVITAGTARDAMRVDELSNLLTESCTACHNRYWYPEEKAP